MLFRSFLERPKGRGIKPADGISHGKKPSVIQTRTGVLGADRIGGIVVSAIKMLAADIENGTLVTIDQHKTRVTLLPL